MMTNNPFASLGLSKELVAWLATDSDRAVEFITGYRNHFARLFSPDMTAGVIAKMNTALDELKSMSSGQFVATARAYVYGGTDEELFGPKRELQQAERKIVRLEQELEAASRQIEGLAKDKSVGEARVRAGMVKILRAVSTTNNLPERALSPAMLRGYTFFGNTNRELDIRQLTPEQSKRRKRKRIHYAKRIAQSIVQVDESGHLRHTLVEVTFRQLILLQTAMKRLNEKVDRVLANQDSVVWEDKGLFIGFSQTATIESIRSNLYQPELMIVEQLASYAAAPHFLIAQDVMRKTKDAETDYLISIVHKGRDLFKVNSFPVRTKGYRAPIASS